MVSAEAKHALLDSPLLITFVVKKENNQWDVRCKGCREVHALQDDSQHPFILGFIEFENQSIPVLDMVIPSQQTHKPITHTYCLLVVEREQQPFVPHVAVLMENLDQILRLAGGDIGQQSQANNDINMLLVLDMMEGV